MTESNFFFFKMLSLQNALFLILITHRGRDLEGKQWLITAGPETFQGLSEPPSARICVGTPWRREIEYETIHVASLVIVDVPGHDCKWSPQSCFMAASKPACIWMHGPHYSFKFGRAIRSAVH